jgi:ankyrin repeat protein
VTQGLRPLHYACYRDYEQAARLLLLRGAIVDALDEVGYSPLHLWYVHSDKDIDTI